MARHYHQGVYEPKNPEKYLGRRKIIFRSGWELNFCRFCDHHPSVTQWASESLAIPYWCPLTQRKKQYIPDFFIVYTDQTGATHVEVVEIKPSRETGGEQTRSRRDQLVALRNQAKWAAAQAYCEKNGMRFRVITEQHMFKL